MPPHAYTILCFRTLSCSEETRYIRSMLMQGVANEPDDASSLRRHLDPLHLDFFASYFGTVVQACPSPCL